MQQAAQARGPDASWSLRGASLGLMTRPARCKRRPSTGADRCEPPSERGRTIGRRGACPARRFALAGGEVGEARSCHR
jgi:hypothetical protein